MLVLHYDGGLVEAVGRGLAVRAVRGIATHPERPGEAWVAARCIRRVGAVHRTSPI